MLLMLEDDTDRVQRFTETLRRLEPDLPLRIWHSAWTMILEIVPLLTKARLLSLDHDLIRAEGERGDPGTGYDLARFLSTLVPTCPVVIHSSNSERVTWMVGALEIEGWQCVRVAPIGEDWIEKDWLDEVRQLLNAKPESARMKPMSRTDRYRGIVRRIIEQYASYKPAHGQIDSKAIVDVAKDHYEVMHVGWDRHRRVHGCVVHIDIIGDKIWIQYDGTNRPVADELLAAGIPYSDIVLGFHPADVRQHTEFAVS